MCWSPAASVVLGVAGVTTAGISAKRGVTKDLTIPLAYFSLMEFIQFFGYSSINQCALPSNQFFTIVSFIHVAFQPIFFNMIYMASTRPAVSKRVRRWVYAASLFVTALLLVKIVPFASQSICSAGQTLCGTQWCSVSGNWHLAWDIPWYNWPLPGDIILYYAAGVFLIPLFYGAWMGIIFALTGPLLAYLTTQNPNEWPAVWCFFSVGLILINLSLIRFKKYLPASFRHLIGGANHSSRS